MKRIFSKAYFSTNVIRISFSDIENISKTKNFSSIRKEIEQAYGKHGLGAIIIKDVPNHYEIKHTLLSMTHRLVNLPADVLKSIESPSTNYAFGWARGKEKYEGSDIDSRKGSFYANLKVYNELKGITTNKSSDENLWPYKNMPELEPAFHALGNQIRQVSFHLVRCIDDYIKNIFPEYQYKHDNIIKESESNKARLLHYFPRQETPIDKNEDWCGWHNDHGSITGLTSAMYFDKNNNIVNDKLKLEKTGLWAQTRTGEKVKVTYGMNDIAYQIGEAYQILSGGKLIATPHAVFVDKDIPEDVHRSTYALFMQPSKKLVMNLPKGASMKDIKTDEIYHVPKLEKRFYKDGMTFEEFNDKTMKAFASDY